ncbi:MAG: NAD(P)/FAD-dependent oxidoreductase [Actinomycetota bacterium]
MDARNPHAVDRVIVIGAGVAGLTAAKVLQKHGTQVVVLEAKERIGGRTSTVDLDGAAIDEGAVWLDGLRGNPLVDWCEQAGLETVRADYVEPLHVAAFDAARGGWIGRFEMLRHLVAYQRASSALEKPSAGAKTLADRIDEVVARYGGRGVSPRIRGMMVRMLAEATWAGTVNQLGPHAAQIGERYPGGETAIVGGYRRLVDTLAHDLDIRLETPVTCVHHRDGRISVETPHGVFRGSHVLITVPLGVLKAGSITFDPPLPADKQSAIDRIGMGMVEKVVLCFDEPFWRRDVARPQNLFFFDDATPSPILFDFTESAGAPVLAALVSGDHGTRLLEDPDAVVAEVVWALHTMFPEKSSTPAAVHVSRWRQDPAFCGSYSTVLPETTAADFATLGQPVGSRLLFAGEATSTHRLGYVDGAMESGLREASRILSTPVTLNLAPVSETLPA